MAYKEQIEKFYNNSAIAYDNYNSLPLGLLETELMTSALGDCTGLSILDLGGGTGFRARQAIEAGAKSVDVVDLSGEMMSIGKQIEASLGCDQVSWHEADISKPLDHLPLGSYDLVMANWLFDVASSIPMLEGMWRNIVANLKPGGRFVGVRSGYPKAPAFVTGKYGVTYAGFEDIPGGLKFSSTTHGDPPVVFAASTSMEVSYSGSTEMHERFGLENVETVVYEDMDIIKRDPEFWKLFLDQPCMAVVTATKRSG